MNYPKLPSFFNSSKNKQFTYKPLYYSINKKGDDKKIRFNQELRNHKVKKVRINRIIFLFIILSLLSYYLLI